MATELRRLLMVAPNFMVDKDEDWMAHLPLEKKTFIVDKRAEILAISEKIENHTQAYRSHLTSLRDADPQRKAQAKKEYEGKNKSFEEERDQRIRDILPTLKRLKSQGLSKKDEIAQRDAATFSKRRRPQDMLDPSLELDPDVELVSDNYMPSYLSSNPLPQTSSNQNKKKRQKSAINTAQELPNLPVNSPSTKSRDTFFDGVEDQLDRLVLTDLRSDIIKLNCRDRVIKAIQSITLRDHRIRTMDSISKINQLMKCSD